MPAERRPPRATLAAPAIAAPTAAAAPAPPPTAAPAAAACAATAPVATTAPVTTAPLTAAPAAAAPTATELGDVRVDSATLDELQRLEGAYSEAHVSPLDAEEEVAVELAEAQAEQAAITATLDALAGDIAHMRPLRRRLPRGADEGGAQRAVAQQLALPSRGGVCGA